MSQIGVDPPHRPMLVAEQAPHAPDAWQAGAVAGHCASDGAGLAGVRAGVADRRRARSSCVSERQATQTRGDTLVKQYGVPPLQSLDCAHCSTSTLVACAPEVEPSPSVG